MTSRSIGFLRVLVISAMCLTLFPAAASGAGDGPTPPVLAALSFPAGIVNAATPVTITVTATFTGDNGIHELVRDPDTLEIISEGPTIAFAPPRGSATAIGYFERTFGDAFTAEVAFPPYAAIGEWTATVVAADLDYSSSLYLDSIELGDLLFPNSISVTGTDDVTAPSLDGLSGPAPLSVDVGDCDYRSWVVQFDATITDLESGFSPDYPSQFIFQSPSGAEQVWANGFEDRGGSVYRMTFNLDPGAETGIWTPYAADLTDVVGNTSNLAALAGDFDPFTDAHFEVVSNPSSETVPGAVSNLTVDLVGGSAVLDWDPPADDGNSPITGYVVDVGIDYSHGYGMPIDDPGVTSATIELTEPGAGYTFSVAALNRCGQGEAVISPMFATIPAGGGTVSTNPGEAIVTEITVPDGVGGGSVIVTATEPDLTVPGWEFVGQQLVITSTAATTAATPLSLVFRFDSLLMPVTIFRDGGPITDLCAGDGTAIPFTPCIASTAVVGEFGELTEITILTASASTWNVAQSTLQQYDFSGFLGDVGNPPTVNRVKAGDTIRIQFGLAGYRGMSFIDAGYPTFASHPCGSPGGTEVSATAAKRGLTYDAKKDAYTFWWSTLPGWKGTCGTFILNLDDGTSHAAEFRFG